MTFSNQLNDYINHIGCSAKELATASGLSEATLSRYRSGERFPEPESEALVKLAAGIAALAKERDYTDLTETDIFHVLSAALESNRTIIPWNEANFNVLLGKFGINIAELARFLNFDASYLSRVRSGQRIPSDPDTFINNTALYMARHLIDEDSIVALSKIMDCPQDNVATESGRIEEIRRFLSQEIKKEGNPIKSFLTKVNDFDLNDYIRAIKFDELKVPNVPFQLTSSKTYYGLKAIKDAEIDFLKSTVLAKNMDPVFMCADMPMEDMSKDETFAKKWMFGLAMMLKKGLNINIVHNLDRPFYELMLGLEAWIPMYMTGQVHPYYMEEKHNSLYCHLNYCSGQVALSGECIAGHHKDSKYYLIRLKDDVAYQKKKCHQILNRAKPLMDIYRQEEVSAFHKKIKELNQLNGVQYDRLNALPLFTMSEELLDRILGHNDLTSTEKQEIHNYYKLCHDAYEELLQNRTVSAEIMSCSMDEFAEYPVHLDISGAYIEKAVLYSYDEYQEHLKQLKTFAEAHANYSYRLTEDLAFRNIQMHILSGQQILISKNTAPAIHFVIQHPTLVHALENFSVPIKD